MEENKFEQIETGIKLIKLILKDIKKPADVNSKKEITESVKLLDNKLKLMKKDDSLTVQYLDRVKFDTIQGVFQAMHLYIISTDYLDQIYLAVDWLRSHENCYSIAERMQKAALARTEFSNGGKR